MYFINFTRIPNESKIHFGIHIRLHQDTYCIGPPPPICIGTPPSPSPPKRPSRLHVPGYGTHMYLTFTHVHTCSENLSHWRPTPLLNTSNARCVPYMYHDSGLTDSSQPMVIIQVHPRLRDRGTGVGRSSSIALNAQPFSQPESQFTNISSQSPQFKKKEID